MRLRDLFTVASAITTFRLGLAATAPWWVPTEVALPVYLLAVLSDVVDGEVARRTATTSRAGAVFDAWVDKALHVNLGWTLAVRDLVPDWFMLAWCARELIQGPFFPFLTHRFRTAQTPPPRTSIWGRATAVALFVSVVLSLVGVDATVPTVVTGLLGTIAGVIYVVIYVPPRRPPPSDAGFPLEGRAIPP